MNFDGRKTMRTLSIIIAILGFTVSTNAQNMLSGKEIYRINRDCIAQISAGNEFGNGFVTSADGIIVTANHVVATRDSHFKQYASNIKVAIFHNGLPTFNLATPVAPQISDDQVNFDYAKLKINASNLPHVVLGSSKEINIGDQITIIPSFPGIGTMLLQGIVSNTAAFKIDLGPKLVDTILFQCPVRNGFSGSPIFNSKGHVIGIVDTKVFGISPALDNLRTKWKESQTGGGAVIFMGVDLASSFLEVINNLDQNLISGLGSGVAIDYVKQQ